MDTMPAASGSPKEHWSTFLRVSYSALVSIPALMFWGVVGLGILAVSGFFADEPLTCNVVKLPVHGIIMADDGGFAELFGLGALSGAEQLIEDILWAQEQESILGILIDIDSPGGTPVAADAVMRALLSSTKPSVALIHDLGTSAAYWVAAGTDHIVASPVSNVGSIGVTMSYTELAGAHTEEGSRFVEISSGGFKDAGNPERVLSEDEERYFQQQVNTVHEYFLDRITEARPRYTREYYARLADGRAYLGTEAYALGLIDEIGGRPEAHAYLADRMGIDASEIELCETESGLSSLLK